jgi:hypothetical protein
MDIVRDVAYVFGGELEPRQPRDNFVHKFGVTKGLPPFSGNSAMLLTFSPEALDAEVHSSAPSGESPTARVGAATTVLNDQIYMFSGRGGEVMAPVDEQGSLWVFNPASDQWNNLLPSSATYPEPRSYHCMTSDGHDTIYLHGGCPEAGRLSDFWAFTVSSARWRQLASPPDPARGGASITFMDGKLYRMNGFDGSSEQGGALDVFDVSSGTWSSLPFAADGVTGPGARSVSALVALRIAEKPNLLTLFGECDPSSLGHQGAGKMLSDIWAFSLSDGAWTQIKTTSKDLPQARGWFDAAKVTADGKDGVVVVGGLGESNERLDDAWILTF